MDKIIIKNVCKTIKKREILKDINLELKKGLVYGFIGRNGSGKTMLLRAISGLMIPTSGSIEVFGEKISVERIFPSSMGLIIENVELWNNLTGLQNLKLIADIKNIITDYDMKIALKRIGLDPSDKRKYKAYSLGMKKKLSIAQAIMEKPELLVLDEPTNGLDKEGVILFRKIIDEEKKRGTTCLIATHLKDDIDLLCDEVYELDNGICIVIPKEVK